MILNSQKRAPKENMQLLSKSGRFPFFLKRWETEGWPEYNRQLVCPSMRFHVRETKQSNPEIVEFLRMHLGHIIQSQLHLSKLKRLLLGD